MAKQFDNRASVYGAPMGRPESRIPDDMPARSVSLVRVRINSQGYDDGGAYWGIDQPLYMATWESNGDEHHRFIRADNRFYAARKLSIPESALKRRTTDPDRERLDARLKA